MITTILWALIGGTAVGFVGKALARSGPDLPLYATVLWGIVGVLLGDLAYAAVFGAQVTGFDGWRHAWQLGGAAVLVAAADVALGLRHRLTREAKG